MTKRIIVIGAGSAGSVVSRRLVDAGHEVLLLEAGSEDLSPHIHSMHGIPFLWHAAEDWDYMTVPQRNAFNRRLHLPRGRVLGGSHALNAVIWVRGTHADHARWVDQGAEGWGWADVAPYYAKIENYTGPRLEGGDERGSDGPLDVIGGDYEIDPIQQAIIDATMATGIRYNEDYNSGLGTEGVAREQVNMRGGRRFNTWMAYARELLGHERFEARTGAHVVRLVVSDAVATGVELLHRGALVREEADHVVLCAGALDSPTLLMRSGIGPADHLREVGIDVVHDLRGVGENLHDHLLSPVICETTAREIGNLHEDMSPSQSHFFAYSREGLADPDTQPIIFSVPMYLDGQVGPAKGFTMNAGMIQPKSRGTLRLGGPNITDRALIDLNVFDDEADLDALVFSVRQCREIVRRSPLADEWGAREVYPGPEVDTPEKEREYVRRTAITYHHQVGTCRMGTDDLAVVDPSLALRGVGGVHVVDASVMPTVTSGNTNAPTVMIGEKGSDLLLAALG